MGISATHPDIHSTIIYQITQHLVPLTLVSGVIITSFSSTGFMNKEALQELIEKTFA